MINQQLVHAEKPGMPKSELDGLIETIAQTTKISALVSEEVH